MINRYMVNGMEILLQDLENSETLKHIAEQVFNEDEYKLNEIDFQSGDVVVDIGANVGSVSILLGKRFPDLKIYSFEPHPLNYQNFVENIRLNNITNITPIQKAVDGESNLTKDLSICYHNTGSTSLYKSNRNSNGTFSVETISFDDIVSQYNINEIKFLKLDCEGSEYDIIQNSKKLKDIKIHNLSVEIHTFMESRGKDTNQLVSLLETVSINKPQCKLYTLG